MYVNFSDNDIRIIYEALTDDIDDVVDTLGGVPHSAVGRILAALKLLMADRETDWEQILRLREYLKKPVLYIIRPTESANEYQELKSLFHIMDRECSENIELPEDPELLPWPEKIRGKQSA